MKIVALNLIFGILLLTSNTNVLLSQVKILDINNISIIETKNKSGKLSYSGVGPNGTKVPVSISYLKAADIQIRTMETNPVIVVIHVFHVAMVVKIYVASVKMTLGLLKYFLKKLPSLKKYIKNQILYCMK